MSGAGRAGLSLLEVLVALVVLEVALLGVVGLLVLSSAGLARAVVLERGASQAAAVADSLVWADWEGPGEAVREDWRVTWARDDAGGIRVQATLQGAESRGAVVELWLP